MAAEEQLRVSLKELHDLKTALDEHANVGITDFRGKITKYSNLSRPMTRPRATRRRSYD
jgi:hypothetical protein